MAENDGSVPVLDQAALQASSGGIVESSWIHDFIGWAAMMALIACGVGGLGGRGGSV